MTPAAPRSWLEGAGNFVDGRLGADAPEWVLATHDIARRLDQALASDGRAKIEVARAAGVSRSTLYAILAGQVVPDVASIARLGAALNVRLWPE